VATLNPAARAAARADRNFPAARRDAAFRAAWDDAIDACTDTLEAKLQELALAGDVTALIFMLRSRMAEVYNPNLVTRKAMLQLALEKARAEIGGLTIDGAIVPRPMIYPARARSDEAARDAEKPPVPALAVVRRRAS
jgi:hypothetical protein